MPTIVQPVAVRTSIGARAFTGVGTLLVAPVSLGEGAKTGAGAVVTKDVPPFTVVAGVPARLIKKLVVDTM